MRETRKKPSASNTPKIKPKQTEYSCPECSKKFTDPSGLHCHRKLHSTEFPFKCEICDYKCKIKKYLSRHMKKTHTEPTDHQCDICGKCFHFSCKLKVHMRVHTGEKPHKCDVCGKAFSSTYSLSGHKMIHTGEKPYQCTYCDYACRDTSTIRKHIERHMGISKDFPCSLCNKIFKRKDTLQFHLDEVHFELNPRKFPCELCDKMFKTKNSLNVHNNAVHKKSNRVNCEICGVEISKTNVLAHLRRHVNLRPYKCSYRSCRRRFKIKGDLKKHLLIHYPDRQYNCTYCNRRFPRKSRLNEHIAMHLRGYRVQCDYCSEMFSSKVRLAKHIRRGHGPNSKKYICDVCGIIISSRRGIIRHLQYGHGTENDVLCQLCKKIFNDNVGLKEHYLKHHNIKYCLLDDKQEVAVKNEVMDDDLSDDDTRRYSFEVDIHKHEIEDSFQPSEGQTSEELEQPPQNSDPATQAVSEQVSTTIVDKEQTTEPIVEEIIIENSVQNTMRNIDIPKNTVDMKKKEIVKKRVEEMLSKVRKRREYKVLEIMRQQYNQRIKMATSSGNKQDKSLIKFFKKSSENSTETDTNSTTNSTDEVNNHNHNNNDSEISVDNRNNDNGNNENCHNEDESKVITTNDNGNSENGHSNSENVTTTDNDNGNNRNNRNNNGDDINYRDVSDDDDNENDYNNEDYDYKNDEKDKNGKLKFNTHQCYICFKLFKTKTDLQHHCTEHFDICNEKTLKKCPFCGFVTNFKLSRHIRLVHDIKIRIPYFPSCIKEKETENGSKYVLQIDKDCDLEIIPSVSNLNKLASIKIDEKNRIHKNQLLATTKLVKKGGNWMVKKEAVVVNNDYLLPNFFKEEYRSLKSIGNTYIERLRSLSLIAKQRKLRMLYPCDGCEKICLTMAALKLHSRKHEKNPKKFKPKIWKNRIVKANKKRGRGKISNESGKITNDTGKITNDTGKSLNDTGKSHNDTGKSQNDATISSTNRFAEPNPVTSKHRCDKALIEFYENNIKGGDIEFWQFLKIFNKMDRENVKDFKDLENRFDFGMHNMIINDKSNITSKENNPKNKEGEPKITHNENIERKSKKNNVKKTFTRAIMISKKEYMKRMEIKKKMRERLQASK